MKRKHFLASMFLVIAVAICNFNIAFASENSETSENGATSSTVAETDKTETSNSDDTAIESTNKENDNQKPLRVEIYAEGISKGSIVASTSTTHDSLTAVVYRQLVYVFEGEKAKENINPLDYRVAFLSYYIDDPNFTMTGRFPMYYFKTEKENDILIKHYYNIDREVAEKLRSEFIDNQSKDDTQDTKEDIKNTEDTKLEETKKQMIQQKNLMKKRKLQNKNLILLTQVTQLP